MNRNRLCRDAYVTAPYPSIAQQAAGHKFCGVDSNRKADPLCRQNRSRVDADYAASRVNERSSGITRIQGGVSLNHILDEASRIRTQRSAERADYARRHRGLKPVRVADRDRHMPGPQLL